MNSVAIIITLIGAIIAILGLVVSSNQTIYAPLSRGAVEVDPIDMVLFGGALMFVGPFFFFFAT